MIWFQFLPFEGGHIRQKCRFATGCKMLSWLIKHKILTAQFPQNTQLSKPSHDVTQYLLLGNIQTTFNYFSHLKWGKSRHWSRKRKTEVHSAGAGRISQAKIKHALVRGTVFSCTATQEVPESVRQSVRLSACLSQILCSDTKLYSPNLSLGKSSVVVVWFVC